MSNKVARSSEPGKAIPPSPDDMLIRRAEMARLAGGVSIASVKRWERGEGLAPKPVRIGQRTSGQWRSVWLAWLAWLAGQSAASPTPFARRKIA